MSLLTKCGLYALLPVALFISSFAYSSDANAASPYDNILKQVDKIETTCLSNGINKHDWTNELGGFILNTDKYDPVYENTINEARTLLNSQFNKGKGWFIQQHYDYKNDPTYVSLTVYDTTQVTPKFITDSNGGFLPPDSPHFRFDGAIYNENYYTFRVVDYGQYGYSCGDYQMTMENSPAWYNQEQKLHALFINDTFTYPEDYTDAPIKDSHSKIEQIRPDFKYSVMTKSLDAHHIKNLKELPTKKGEDYVVDWALFKCKTHDPVAYTCEDPKLVKQQSLAPGESFKYEVDKYSWYKLDAQYLSGGCHRYDSYPATPDYCWYEKPANTDKYEYIATTVFLDINGEMISGSTAGDDCSNGFCKPPSEFKDCSVYGIGELFDLITCHVNNFFVNLKNFFNMLFLPNGRQIEPIFDRFTSFINTKFGFLATSVSMIKDFTGELLQQRDGKCNFKVSNSGAFGRPEPLFLNFCYFPDNFPTQTDILLSMIRAVTAMSFVAMIYTRYNALMKGE